MTVIVPILDPVANIKWIPINRIEANPFQPRQIFTDEELEELAASIKEHGVLQPILVRPHPTKPGWFQLVSGERRWRAGKIAGLVEIPGTIKDVDDLESAKLALIENIQRENLTDWEEARGMERLWQTYERAGRPISVAVLREEIDKSRVYIKNRLDALKYQPEVQAMMARHRGVLSSAREINGVAEPERRETYIKLVDEGKSYVDVLASIQRDDAEIAVKARASQAPDAQTQSRAGADSRGESSSMSRGLQVTGPTRAEANSETLRHAQGLEAWITKCDDKTYELVAKLARRILREDLSR